MWKNLSDESGDAPRPGLVAFRGNCFVRPSAGPAVGAVDEALTIVGRYFDDDQLLPKTRLVLEEILERD